MPALYELVQGTIKEATEEIDRGSEPLAVVLALRAAALAVEYAHIPSNGGRRVTDRLGSAWQGGSRLSDRDGGRL